jgi:DNA-binding NtrC family response regulator
MKKELRVLMIEDDAPTGHVRHDLCNVGLTFRSARVQTKDDFLHALLNCTPEVILSGHGLPEFEGFAALAAARRRCPNVPFIFVTGSPAQGAARKALKGGAADFIVKNRLHLLVPVIRRALAEAKKRAERRRIELEHEALLDELGRSLAQVTTLTELLPICVSCQNIRDDLEYWAGQEMYRREQESIRPPSSICQDCAGKHRRQG